MTREQRLVFDEVAELYERTRPTYPADLAEDIIGLSNLPPGGRILEVGSGTGKGTELFARRGYDIHCLEPAPAMAAIARRKFGHLPNVIIEETLFENWPLPPEPFDLLISAQAYHWVPPEVRWTKAAAALRPGGVIALWWNEPDGPDEPDLEVEFRRAYAEHAPDFPYRTRRHQPAGPEDEIERSGLFGPVWMNRYPWRHDRDARAFVEALETQSDHRMLSEPRRAALLAALVEIIDHAGGTIRLSNAFHLFFARKRS